jgi:hypothetical protein
MRSTFQNSGTALSIGVFFSLMITGLAGTLPKALSDGLVKQGVPTGTAHHIASLPPVSSLFAAVLGINPLQHLLALGDELRLLPANARRVLTGHEYFPGLISGPFERGLTIVFAVSAGLAFVGAIASFSRGPRPVREAVPSVDAGQVEPPVALVSVAD